MCVCTCVCDNHRASVCTTGDSLLVFLEPALVFGDKDIV